MMGELLDLARDNGVRLNCESVRYGEYMKNLARNVGENLVERGFSGEIAVNAEFQGNVSLDRERFGRIIENLVRNAAEALQPRASGGVIEISCHEEGSLAVARVSDNGPGIPEPIMEGLFLEKRSMGKAEGSGYGLLICKELAELHGGSIECSTSNAGTIFTVRIPKERQAGKNPLRA